MEFRDLKKQYSLMEKEIDNAIKDVLVSSRFIGGNEVQKLEEDLAKYVGVKHCISCANGTDALMLVLRAWGVGPGDAVFVPDFTFFATAEVVSLVGATPVFCNVNEDTFNICHKSLEEQIKNTISKGQLIPKAIIPVDLFGLPSDYDKIEEIASKYELKILEDAAQGFGGSINGKMAGSFGDAATTSFFPAKPLGCYGDGGAIFTNDDSLKDLLMSLKVHGKGKDKYDNVRIGVNSRLDSIQAAVLSVKFKYFPEELLKVNQVYKWYNKHLNTKLTKPNIPEGFYSSFAQYTVRLHNTDLRDELVERLKEQSIPTMIYYKLPLHKQGAHSHIKTDYNFTTQSLCDSALSLPMHPYLTEDDVIKVSEIVNEVLNNG